MTSLQVEAAILGLDEESLINSTEDARQEGSDGYKTRRPEFDASTPQLSFLSNYVSFKVIYSSDFSGLILFMNKEKTRRVGSRIHSWCILFLF